MRLLTETHFSVIIALIKQRLLIEGNFKTIQKDEKVETMLDQMSVAFSDEDVKNQPELREMIFNYAQELTKTQNTGLVATKMVKSLVQYYWITKTQLPEAAIKLHHQIKRDATVYDGIAMSAMLLPVWF